MCHLENNHRHFRSGSMGLQNKFKLLRKRIHLKTFYTRGFRTQNRGAFATTTSPEPSTASRTRTSPTFTFLLEIIEHLWLYIAGWKQCTNTVHSKIKSRSVEMLHTEPYVSQESFLCINMMYLDGSGWNRMTTLNKMQGYGNMLQCISKLHSL